MSKDDYLDDGDGVDYSGYFVNDKEYDDYHDIHEWSKTVALPLGWEMVINSIKRTSATRRVVYLRCNRGERYRGKGKVLSRKTKTKACGCKFKIHAVQIMQNGPWTVEVCPGKEGMHNHPLMRYPEGHRQVSGLSPAAKKHVRAMRRAHTKPANIHESLRQNFPEDNPTRQHVYNCNSKMRIDDAEGRSVMQHFIHLADQGKYQKWMAFDGETHATTHIFAAHPTSINLLRTYPWVLLMDSTYKTNKYSMPLFEIVGVTPTNQNFLVGVALMRDETAISYWWVLDKLSVLIGRTRRPAAIITDRELALFKPIKELFPTTRHLLCTWHINKDVEARVYHLIGKDKPRAQLFKTDVWAKVLYAETELRYGAAVRRMNDAWRKETKVLAYVHGTWLKYKEMFVKAWTDNVLNFNNTTTCRAESQHSSLKSWLITSTNSVDGLFVRMNAMVEAQLTGIRYSLEESVRRHGIQFREPPYQHLVGRVSAHGLALLEVEVDRMKDLGTRVDELCGCVIRRKCGLPCACELRRCIDESGGIYLDRVHVFWRTLEIGDGVDDPDFVEEIVQDTEHFNALVDEVRTRDPAQVRYISRLLHHALYPQSSDPGSPTVNTEVRGRPSNQGSSTRRNRSAFEYIGNRRSTTTQSTTNASGSGMRVDENVFPYSDELPAEILPYIVGWNDVIGDGHCGFRCVADAFQGNEDQWHVVRNMMASEITRHPDVYDAVYYHQREAAIHRIDYYGRFAGQPHWMETNVDLFTIANLYRCAVHFYTLLPGNVRWGCVTVLPWQVPSTIRAPQGELAIALIQSKSHYIRLHLSDNYPVPPVAQHWYNFQTESVADWPNMYANRIADWNRMTG